MKKNILYAAAATFLVLTASCKDSWLEVENPNGDPLEEYYTTEEHLEEALVAAYDPIHWPDWGLGQYNALNIDAEILGDNFWVGGETTDDMHNWHLLFNYDADENNTLSSLWTVDYSGIKRCNDLLLYLGWANQTVSKESLKLKEMQARCMRVFYYNMLWHYFGNVPFYLENLTAETNYTAPQLKADDVYAKLIVELEEVIDSKVLPMRWDSNNSGRASQAFAYMMYAEMVMYQNDETRYAKALGYMNEIINSGKYDLLKTDFADLWKESGEWCCESIWEINYEDGNSERGWGSPLAVGGTVMPTLIAPNNYKPEDSFGDGWGFLPVRKSTYAMYSEGDKRRDATIWDLTALDGKPEEESYHRRYQDTGLWLKKYRPFAENNVDAGFDNNLNYNNNYRYYRYAETLLNAAELILRTGGSAATATGYVNDIRERAGLSRVASVTIDDIIQERNLEFVGEGKRYWDLVRTGKAATVLVPDEFGYRTNSWTPNKKYIPIAQAELDSDPALKQNDY